jgi:hypothetical protein
MGQSSPTGIDAQKAKRNYEDTLRHLQEPERDFLEIGRLLIECKDSRYFEVLGYSGFVEYVRKGLKGKIEYSTATRCMHHHRFSTGPLSPGVHILRRIGKAKMDLLLPIAEDGRMSSELWKWAEDATWEQFRRDKNRYKSFVRPTSRAGEEGSRHRKIQQKVREIGESLGRYAQTEYPSYPSKEYRYDVVWKTHELVLGATHVFEVCDKGGDLEHDINKLAYAYSTMGHPHLLLVVAKPQDKSAAESLVSRGAGGDMSRNLTVVTAQRIDQLYDELELPTISEFINLFIR